MKPIVILIVCCLQLLTTAAFAKNSFFEELYRIWLWFKEMKVLRGTKIIKNKPMGCRKVMICGI